LAFPFGEWQGHASPVDWAQWFESASYVVTVIGLPFVLIVFINEQRRERTNGDEDEDYCRWIARFAAEGEKVLVVKPAPPTKPLNAS
jgi:hypothetical protein